MGLIRTMKRKRKAGRPRFPGATAGRSKKQLMQYDQPGPIDRTPQQWKVFESGLFLGSISDTPKPYEGRFESIEVAVNWWKINRKAFIQDMNESPTNPGTRPNIFWELEFGMTHPEEDEAIRCLDKHALWLPGERKKLIEWGDTLPANLLETIPGLKPCTYHVHGYPVIFTKEPGVRFKDGEWQQLSCEWERKSKGITQILTQEETNNENRGQTLH